MIVASCFNVHDEVAGELGGEDAALGVVLGDADAMLDRERGMAGEGRDARVTLFLRRVPMHLPARRLEVVLDLLAVRLDLL